MKIKIEKMDEATARKQGITDWPIWECEVSEFPWHYDQEESCFLIEGEVTVTTDLEVVHIGPGDYVTFPKGLDCRWQVSVPVRKHFTFR
jgi:uncharacterized cupin superfamily protein